MSSRRHRIGGVLLLAVTLAFASVLLLGLTLGSSRAPAAPKCGVSLKYTPKRSYAGQAVTITASASNCDRITKIVADKPISGVRSYPCKSGSACTIRVAAPKPQLVHFTAQATKNGRAVKSHEIAVRWSKPLTPDKPKKFTMSIKDTSGKIVLKGVQDIPTYKTTFTGGEGGGMGQVRLQGGSKVTLSASFDVPIRTGGRVAIAEEIYDSATGTSDYKTLCETSRAGASGCSTKLALPQADYEGQPLYFQAQGTSANTVAGSGSIRLEVILQCPPGLPPGPNTGRCGAPV